MSRSGAAEMIEELQPDTLLGAYCAGIFPMADDSGEISWFSPDPRAIIPLDEFNIPRSLRQRIRKGNYETKIDTCFQTVISRCAVREEGTWISDHIAEAYCKLHDLGHAHSIETFYEGELAGGLYGVSLGGAFFGESMFTDRTDGSKLALAALVRHMKQRGLALLDIQFLTPHLLRFGAKEVPRAEYLRQLKHALSLEVTFVGP